MSLHFSRPDTPVFAVFGSVATDSHDALSDFDVLCVTPSGAKVDIIAWQKAIDQHTGEKVSLSIYSWPRIDELWKCGSPFAWHLRLEARRLAGFDDPLKYWSDPCSYVNALDDLMLTRDIFFDSCKAVLSAPTDGELVFECGVLASCLRNAAIYASLPILGGWVFGRDAPYMLGDRSISMDRCIYNELVMARVCSRRGGRLPRMDRGVVLEAVSKGGRWISDLVEAVK